MTSCAHLEQSRIISPKTQGCEECLQSGEGWVHLRVCLTCGHVGCCDDSRNKHATAHFHSTQHPVIKSLEPDESWRWCYIDELLVSDDADSHEAANVTSSTQSLPLPKQASTNGRTRGMFKSICRRVRRCDKKNLEPVIELALRLPVKVAKVAELARSVFFACRAEIKLKPEDDGSCKESERNCD